MPAIWHLLKSTKLTLALMLVFAGAIVIYGFLTKDGQSSGMIIRSWWFSLLCLILLFNLTAATCSQWLKYLRSFRRLGVQNRITRFGIVLFHTGLILIVTGSLISAAFGMTGYLMAAEGETRSENHNDYEYIEEGPLFKEKWHYGLALKLLKQNFDGSDILKDSISRIQITDGSSITNLTLPAGGSVSYRDLRLFSQKNGFAPKIRITDPTGVVISDSFLLLDTVTEGNKKSYQTTAWNIPGAPFSLNITLLPGADGIDNYQRGVEMVISKTQSAPGKQPVYNNVKQGQEVTISGYRLSLGEIRLWSGVLLKRDPGRNLVYTGYFASLFGIIPVYLYKLLTFSSAKY